MIIRRALKTDLDKINDLLYQVHLVHAKARPDVFRLGNKKYTDSEILEIIEDDNRPVFVAEIDGEVLGYAFIEIHDIKNSLCLTDRKYVYIDDLCVDENSRGKNIGTALYEYVKNYAKSINCTQITLSVWNDNEKAVKFYEKLGLKPLKFVMEDKL